MKEIPLSQGKVALVDDEDFEKLNCFKWHYALGYARRNIRLSNGKRKIIFMHRVIANTPDDMVTDHINGNTLDNRKINLRNVTKIQNTWNARKTASAKSNFKGVQYHKRTEDIFGKWKARIQVNKRTINLGYFHSEIQAALAYNKAAEKYHGEFAVLNEVKSMNFAEYQSMAERTVPKEKWFNTKVSNFCMGLAGETGEVVDYLKKVIYHEHELDIEKIKEELGDVLWYVSNLATTMNIDLDDLAKKNIEKLKKRYPEGFSEDASRNRVI
ncbi:MazG nucleotide pyrophosphohydrolase domain-containing protein [Fictibacillus sp. Mic-4]|uniref:MazG nucleotide pyrophosphohydrolase domain-containing protein n=1 Tax=Fictibacillus sp. Mic-4 TaxID=3132826 RepID=UPI003CEDBB67